MSIKKLIPQSIINLYHKFVAIFAALIYFFPARNLKVIGVTGTNGKTTTLNLIAKILEEQGERVGMISTAVMKIGGKSWLNETKMTSLNPFALNQFLAKLRQQKIKYALLEVSSHALEQSRFWGVPFTVGIFTNLTPEHLDYHQDLTQYRKAKEKLFQKVAGLKSKESQQTLIINTDDKAAKFFNTYQANQKYHYQIQKKNQPAAFPKSKNEDLLVAKKIKLEPQQTIFELETKEFQGIIKTHLSGIFNLYNTLAAIACGLSQNIPLTTIQKALQKIKGIPGRMETIKGPNNLTAIVDYAHTPEALSGIYQTLKPLIKNRLIAILGACGDRDKTKRPKMGLIAAKSADLVIITDEDPYTEDSAKIRAEVIAGVIKGGKKEKQNFWEIPDRKEAIAFAIQKARLNDLIIITGKGCEQWMVVGRKKIPWDDRKIVRKLLRGASPQRGERRSNPVRT